MLAVCDGGGARQRVRVCVCVRARIPQQPCMPRGSLGRPESERERLLQATRPGAFEHACLHGALTAARCPGHLPSPQQVVVDNLRKRHGL